jgi:hypothetical protein
MALVLSKLDQVEFNAIGFSKIGRKIKNFVFGCISALPGDSLSSDYIPNLDWW